MTDLGFVAPKSKLTVVVVLLKPLSSFNDCNMLKLPTSYFLEKSTGSAKSSKAVLFSNSISVDIVTS